MTQYKNTPIKNIYSKTVLIQVTLTMSIIVSASIAKLSPISSQPVESWPSIRTAN